MIANRRGPKPVRASGSVIDIQPPRRHRPVSSGVSRRVEDPGWPPHVRRSDRTAECRGRGTQRSLGRAIAATLLGVVLSAGRALAADDEGEVVLVRGDRVPPASREPSVASTVIKAERLRAPGLRTADLLRSQPGFQVAESGGAGALR